MRRPSGEGQDRIVGGCCIDEYTYVTGRRGSDYHVHDDQAVEVDGTYYDRDYLSDNGIVELWDGEYCSMDDAVSVGDEWYHSSDDTIVCDHDGEYQLINDCVQLHDGEWALQDETWECAGSGNFYLYDDDAPVEIDGNMYHEDYVPDSTPAPTPAPVTIKETT
jgi:hypothetical protein